MSETLIPLTTFRWLRIKDAPFNIFGPNGRLQQAFRKPGSDILIWQDVPEMFVAADDQQKEAKP